MRMQEIASWVLDNITWGCWGKWYGTVLVGAGVLSCVDIVRFLADFCQFEHNRVKLLEPGFELDDQEWVEMGSFLFVRLEMRCSSLYTSGGEEIRMKTEVRWVRMLDMQVTLHYEAIVMQVTLHDKRIVMQVTLHYEAIVMQVTFHDKRIVMQVTLHYEAIVIIVMQVALHYEAIVMQVTLHDKRIVMEVALHYEAIVMQVTLHDKRIVMEVALHYEAIVIFRINSRQTRSILLVVLDLDPSGIKAILSTLPKKTKLKILEDYFSTHKTYQAKEEPANFALMAIPSSRSSDNEIAHSFVQSTKQVTHPRHSVQPVEASIPTATPNPTSPKTSSSVLPKSKPVSVTTVRPICADVPKIMMTRPRHAHSLNTRSNSTIRRHKTYSHSSNTSNSSPKVTAAKALVVSAAKGKKGKWV
nr:hypothetical protein [Tanacetum cinerariifolium]